jgi:gamma-glutamyltranspeptidase
MFLPGSMEWQAWHFLKTRRPAVASPVPGAALEAAVAALEAGGGALEAGVAGDCRVVALGDGVSLAAMWS